MVRITRPEEVNVRNGQRQQRRHSQVSKRISVTYATNIILLAPVRKHAVISGNGESPSIAPALISDIQEGKYAHVQLAASRLTKTMIDANVAWY